MAETINIFIMTPERTLLQGEAEMIFAPGTAGEFGVFPKHQNMLTPLDIGELRVTMKENEIQRFAIHSGFLEVSEGAVTVLADTAEPADEIDIERAQQSEKRATKRLEAQQEKFDIMRAKLALQRALARMQIHSEHIGKEKE